MASGWLCWAVVEPATGSVPFGRPGEDDLVGGGAGLFGDGTQARQAQIGIAAGVLLSGRSLWPR